MDRICIRMLQIPFQWFKFGFQCFESLSTGSNCTRILQIHFDWLEFAFEFFESLLNGSNLDSNASNPFLIVWICIRILLHYSTIALLHSTSLYITLPWLYLTPLDPTLLYHGATSLYLTLQISTIRSSTWLCIALPWLYFTLDFSTLALLHSTWLYISLPWLYFTFLNLHYSTMALLCLLYSTLLYHGSTSLCYTLQYSTKALLHSTLL